MYVVVDNKPENPLTTAASRDRNKNCAYSRTNTAIYSHSKFTLLVFLLPTMPLILATPLFIYTWINHACFMLFMHKIRQKP